MTSSSSPELKRLSGRKAGCHGAPRSATPSHESLVWLYLGNWRIGDLYILYFSDGIAYQAYNQLMNRLLRDPNHIFGYYKKLFNALASSGTEPYDATIVITLFCVDSKGARRV